MNRRGFLSLMAAGVLGGRARPVRRTRKSRPNILFAIADDQSFAHTGGMGDRVVQTPTFDRLAEEGVLFRHAYCSSPSCTPSRGAILTGQDFWRLEEGANLWSTLPAKFEVYPDLLERAGYHLGFVGKGWGPGQFEPGGRARNPAGPAFKSFGEFLDGVPEGRPFCFWFGSHNPHRPYDTGSGLQSGKKMEDVCVPPFLPDVPEVRSDILDYYVEIERFDEEVAGILRTLKERRKFENTVIVMTSDNGMPFPRCKTNLYDYGVRMPLALCWRGEVQGGRVVDDFVSFADFARTFLEAAGLDRSPEMTGKSFLDVVTSSRVGRVDPRRDRVFYGRERHAWGRHEGLAYPSRAIRTHHFLYIRNFEPDRWPAGDPEVYADVDGRSPTKTYMLEHRDEEGVRELFVQAFGKRPEEELYDLESDPHEMVNVAERPEYGSTKGRLAAALERRQRKTGDPRATREGEAFDRYPYYGGKDPSRWA